MQICKTIAAEGIKESCEDKISHINRWRNDRQSRIYSNNINPCDNKYIKDGIPNPYCLKEKHIKSGCTEKGTGYKILDAAAQKLGVSGYLDSVKNLVSKVNKFFGNLSRGKNNDLIYSPL